MSSSDRQATVGRPGDQPDEPPPWVQRLVAAARERSAEELSRFLPPPGGGRRSAVLILLGEDSRGPTVLVTERAETLRSHAGQPAFPGGRVDGSDAGPVAAALREAAEETGLDESGVDVLAVLPDLFMPVNSSVVTPVLAWWRVPGPVGVMDAAEVASVHVLALADLADPRNRRTVRHPSGYAGPGFLVAGLLVWGFTANLLDHVLRMGGFEEPWDRTRVEPLPERVVELARRDRAAAEITDERVRRP